MRIALITIVHEIWIEEECGIASLTSYLRTFGHTVQMFEEKYSDVKILLNNVKVFYPDIIGVTIYDDTFEIINDAILQLYNIMPKSHFVLGGITATNNYAELFKQWNFVEQVFLGEGENSFVEYVDYLQGKIERKDISSTAYILDGKICTNNIKNIVDLNKLPFMAHDSVIEKKGKIVTICTSRGCSRACSFCSSPKIWNGWRGKNPILVVDEIEYVQKQYDIGYFNLNDNSIEDPDGKYIRFLEIAEKMIEREVNACYKANTRIESIKYLDKEKIDILKKSGLCIFFLGVEASNEADLKLYNKKINLMQIDDSLKKLERNNLPYFIGYINFNPYSTFESLEQNIDWLHKHNFTFYIRRLFSQYFCYKEHALYQKLKEDNLVFGEKGPYKYHYIDKRIEKMVTGANNTLEYLLSTSKIFEKLNIISREWAVYDIAHLQRYIENSSNIEMLNFFILEKKNVTDTLKELGDYNYLWFKKMLNMCKEENITILEIENYMKSQLNNQILNKFVIQLQNIKLQMYRKLLKFDRNINKHMN